MSGCVEGLAGYLGGAATVGALWALFSRKTSADKLQAKNLNNGLNLEITSPKAGRSWQLMSPGFRHNTPANARASVKVSGDAFLTTKLADFSVLGGLSASLEEDPFISLLELVIAQSKFVQNSPPLGIVPEEKRVADIVTAHLKEFTTEAGGPLVLETLEYVPGRPNLKITYPGTGNKTVAFVGSHMDVVPADASTWNVDPFKLTRDGDKLYGRGTTDCLGHVVLLTRFLAELAKAKPKLKRTFVVVFIAAEEGGEHGVGIDMLIKANKLSDIKNGPCYWVDTADSQPCCGTTGALNWHIVCNGRLFHSGFPHKGINSIEMASQVVASIQERFYDDFPPHPDEEAYQFSAGSTMKPTQIECAKGSSNQICPQTTVKGDIRLSPFYTIEDCMAAIEMYVQEVNDNIDELPTKGTFSKFVLPPEVTTQPDELRRGKVELKWQGSLESFKDYAGVAVSLQSEGHKAIVQACRETYGSAKPFSINGSLPLVSMMRREGFDIQLVGFGLLSVYHGVNEHCLLSHMRSAHEVVCRIVSLLETAS